MEEFSQAQSLWKQQATTKFLGKDVQLKGSMYSAFCWKALQFPMSFQSVCWLPLEDTNVDRAEKEFLVGFFLIFYNDCNMWQPNQLPSLCLIV